MKRKKQDVPKVHVCEGTYECPVCGGINYLDSYEFTQLTNKRGKMLISRPMCKYKIKLFAYEPDNYPEL